MTHDGRCARHNRVMKRMDKMLKMISLKTWMEPIIPMWKTFIKPDIVMEKGQTTYYGLFDCGGAQDGGILGPKEAEIWLS